MRLRTLEITVGVFVTLGLISVLILAMKVSNLSGLTNEDGYDIEARFENIGGLKVKSQVTMGGVRVGRVAGIRFDDESYEAVVIMSIQEDFDRIPADTTASILTSGLLGEQYIGLDAGGEEAFLKEGDQITLTQSALVLEQIIGQFLFNKVSEGAKPEPASAPSHFR